MIHLPTDRMTVTLDSLRFYARHGVGAQERAVGNDFEVTVSIVVPMVYDDDLDSTVSYADIASAIRDEMEVPSALIEHVAVRIRDTLLRRWPQICGGSVRVAKLKPPVARLQLASASVTLDW